MTPPCVHHRCEGFTLTELAVVLVIVALLIGGMMIPLSTQNDLRRVAETRKTLDDIRDALVGFAAANGRLPCPATAASNGIEDPIGGGDCDANVALNSYSGFVPAVTLGIAPTDGAGYAIDAWGTRIHYAVYPTKIGTQPNPFTSADGMRLATMSSIAATNPLLSICACGSAVTFGATPADAKCGGTCPPGAGPGKLADHAVAVIYSLGKNTGTAAAGAGTGAGEQHNPNPNSGALVDPDAAFVSHTPTASGTEEGEFDDIVIWLSPNILFNKMIAAGQLP